MLLLAPRRVGKTSLMLRLRDAAADRDFEAAYLSVAGAKDEAEFVRKLYEAVSNLGSAPAILKRLGKSPLARFFKRIKKLTVSNVGIELGDESPWREFGAGLAEALDRHEGRRLVLIDEIPVFVLSLLRLDPTGDRARQFLSWFRDDLRQSPARQGGVRWLLAGSIGLDTVTARLGLGDTINDLYLVRLGPFERETARQFLSAMSSSYGFPLPERAVEHTLDRIGWLIPYYLQLLFRELRAYCDKHDASADVAAIDAVFDDLLSPSKRGYFDYWRQRLEEELGKPDAGRAVLLLNAVATDPKGASRSTLEQVLAAQIEEVEDRDRSLRYLLDVLESDGYLTADKERYVFRSPLLREFWQRRVAP